MELNTTLTDKTDNQKIKDLVADMERIKQSNIQMEKNFRKLNDFVTKSINAERQVVTHLVDCADDENVQEKYLTWKDSVSEKQRIMNSAVKVINDVLISSGRKYCNNFNDISLVIKQREQVTQEIESVQTKLNKIESKSRTGPNIVKVKELEMSLAKMNTNINVINNVLVVDSEMINESTPDFFNLPLKCLIQSHLMLLESIKAESQLISQLFDDEIDLMKLGATPEEHLANRLKEIQTELSIVRREIP